MRTHELANRLLESPDMPIIMQTDEEGNGYKPMQGADFDVVYWFDDYDHEHMVYSKNWTADEADMDEGEWEDVKI